MPETGGTAFAKRRPEDSGAYEAESEKRAGRDHTRGADGRPRARGRARRERGGAQACRRLAGEARKEGGFAATYVHVEAPEEETHRFLPDVEAIINKGKLTAKQRDLALRIFRRLAEAEAAVHGIPIERVHFHEVGALDSIADIIGAAVGIDLLGVERFTSRSVPTGHGMVKCAHGMMPIPAPGTAELLKGVPLRPTTI